MDILEVLAENKDIGFGILMFVALFFMIKVFLKHIEEEAERSRETHKTISENSMAVVKEATATIASLHLSNEKAHSELLGKSDVIISKLDNADKKIDEVRYQVNK